MKKTLLSVCAALLLAGTSVCRAEIAVSEIALDGLTLDDSPEKLVQQLGRPTNIKNEDRGMSPGGDAMKDITYVWNGFSAYYSCCGSTCSMSWMEAAGDSTMKTPSGLGTGLPESALKAYGKPYDVEKGDDGTEISFWAPNRNTLVFTVKNGRICSVRACR